MDTTFGSILRAKWENVCIGSVRNMTKWEINAKQVGVVATNYSKLTAFDGACRWWRVCAGDIWAGLGILGVSQNRGGWGSQTIALSFSHNRPILAP